MMINNESAELIFTILAVIAWVGVAIAWFFTRDTSHKHHSPQSSVRK